MNNTTNLTEIFEKSQVGPVLGTYLNFFFFFYEVIKNDIDIGNSYNFECIIFLSGSFWI
jgi:hypothetical protein